MGGVVFGAIYNEGFTGVHHAMAFNMQELALQRKSKYVQSNTRDTFAQTEFMLKQGIVVLYSGTPCQIDGLKRFLKGDYSNLFTCDFICHGVPSERIFEEHMSMLRQEYSSEIIDVDFRVKMNNLMNIRIKVEFKNNKLYVRRYGFDAYFKPFIKKLLQRKSCFGCQYDYMHSSDIIMGDVHKLERFMVDLKKTGEVSLVIINSDKGKVLFDKIADNLKLFQLSNQDIVRYYFCEKNPDETVEARNNFMKKVAELGLHKASRKCLMHGSYWFYRILYFLKGIGKEKYK